MRTVEKIIVVLLLMVAVTIPACVQKENRPPVEKKAGDGLPAPEAARTVTTASGLVYQDVVLGTGSSPVPGKPVKVHYTGTLQNGVKFDSSLDRGIPFDFVIGIGQVIPGWDEGLMGMKVGGKRKLTIPPQLGYGAAGSGAIPPNATLLFDVELIDAVK
jgi:peptidylprolyl isomerase